MDVEAVDSTAVKDAKAVDKLRPRPLLRDGDGGGDHQLEGRSERLPGRDAERCSVESSESRERSLLVPSRIEEIVRTPGTRVA